MGFLAIYSFVTTLIDKSVSKGIFRYSRNPMYLSFFILSISISLVSISWIYFLIALIWMVFIYFVGIPVEESECTKKYGIDYIDYVERTPRWIGLPSMNK